MDWCVAREVDPELGEVDVSAGDTTETSALTACYAAAAARTATSLLSRRFVLANQVASLLHVEPGFDPVQRLLSPR
jgi:hypothetical protein